MVEISARLLTPEIPKQIHSPRAYHHELDRILSDLESQAVALLDDLSTFVYQAGTELHIS